MFCRTMLVSPPTRDKAHWEKMNGVEIKLPLYSKRIGRPKKSRRKQPQELGGGKKLSKHGVKIQCSYCKDYGHNRNGRNKRKADDLARSKMPVRWGPIQVPNKDFVQPDTPQVKLFANICRLAIITLVDFGFNYIMSSVNYSEQSNSILSTLIMEVCILSTSDHSHLPKI